MIFSFRLFKITLKKYLSSVIYALIGAIVPLVVIGTIAFCVINTLGKGEPLVKGQVAVVSSEKDDPNMNFAFKYAENMDSTSDTMVFKIMDDLDEAKSLLKEKKIIAIIYLPPDTINGILNGDNIPATIYFSTEENLTSVFLSEITKATADMLSAAQAGTYTVSTLYKQLDVRWVDLNDAYRDVDEFNFTYVLTRERTFKTINVTIDENIKVKNNENTLIYFYTASALLIFLLILGAPFTRFLQKESDAFYSLLKTRKLGVICHDLIIYLIYTINVFLFELVFFTAISKIELYNITMSPLFIINLFVTGLVISSFTFLLSKISNNTYVYVLLVFFCALLLPFISGLIIPMAFIPDGILNIGFMLPFYGVQNTFYNLISFGEAAFTLKPLIWSIVFVIIGIIFNKIKIERAR